jgi:hypothetical protein
LAKTNERLVELFMNALISGGIAFRWVENPFLLKFFKELQSGFKLPTEWLLRTSCLEKCHKKAEKEIEKMISESESVTIAIDGWENVRNLSVLNIMLRIPESIFYKSTEVGGESVDNVVIQREIKKVIEEIGESKVAGILSDNGSPMILAQRELVEKYPNLIAVRCAAHVINLLIEDLCKLNTIYTLIINAKSIVKEITGSKRKKGLYNEEWFKYINDEKMRGRKVHKISLCLPVATRWYSVRNMFSHLRRAKPVLERMAINDEIDLNDETKRIIKSDDFWNQLNHFYDLFQPLVEGIFK